MARRSITQMDEGGNMRGIAKLVVAAIVSAGVILVGSALIWLMGSRNPATPAGYVGYVTQGAVFGKARFIGTQTGPTSAGRTWLADVVNVSITPYTYNEEFTGERAVLSRDNLKIAFAVHVVWRVHPDLVKEFVEKYSTIQHGDSPDQVVRVAYDNFLREPLRTYARDELQKLDGLEIKNQIGPIGASIFQRMQALTKSTPFEITSIVVGTIQYPAAVADAVAEKLASTQILERKKIEVLIAEAEAQRKVADARGIAQAMEIINQRLTPSYIQYLAIEGQKAMVNSPNHTTIYIPVGPMGVPLVGTLDMAKTTETSTGKAK